ncbi:MAG: hypothetical protein ABF289_13395 [Clostridiales bacterium]
MDNVETQGRITKSFKTSSYVFGGSRYNFGTDKMPLNKDEFIKILTESQSEKIADKRKRRNGGVN